MGRPSTLRVDIVADARKVGPGVDQAERGLGRLGSIGRKVGLAAGAGLALAGAAAVKFGVDAVKSASDLQQAQGAVATVFGKSAGAVNRWAANAADSVGLAKSEYSNLAALVGSQLQGMGMAQDKSAGKSRDLIKLGADLAATYGGSVNDAVQAVSSTLKGETDPIERYGVSIKQADVNARLAAMGLDGLTGKAAKQAQAQAVLSLLTEQTSKATGAFSRESNTLAGQQERLNAKFENLKATLGQKLLPVATAVVSWASERMLPAAVKLGGWLQQHLGPAFAAVGSFVTQRAIPAARQFVDWFQDKIVPGIRQYLTPVLNSARAAFGNVADAVSRNKPQLQQLLSAARTVAEWFAEHILPLMGKQVGVSFRLAGAAIGGIVDTIGGLTRAVSTAVGWVRSLIGWISRIHVPNLGALGSIAGKLGLGAASYATMRPQLAGAVDSFDNRRPFATAALATGAGAASSTWAGLSAGAGTGVTVVDARDLSVTVQLPPNPLGLVDEAALARRLQRILSDHQVRVGNVSTYGAGRG